tara:strand:- start:17612 stop:18136 length:525 start_codon:yes stop_codon:yes gene_type:complete
MFKYRDQKSTIETKLYNKILVLSRNKIFYTKFGLSDTFQNRINLIFLHISFLFNKLNFKNKNISQKKLNQKVFDLTFQKIELNMREIGYGDVTVNKNMKFLVKIFYNILLNSESYNKKDAGDKKLFLINYLSLVNKEKDANNVGLIEYFDKYQAFCFDLSLDNVVQGDINFTFK